MSHQNSFSNEEFYPDALPDALEVAYHKLNLSYKTYSLLSATIGFGIFFLITLFVLLIAGELNSFFRVMLFLTVMAVLYITRMFIKYYAYGKKGYAVRRHDVLFKSGIWWKRHVFVPKNRIQHVEIKKTPLEDMFNISRLLIYTAGGSGSDLVIPGLLPEVAERMKENLMEKIAHDQEE
jgi:membrane protein YdbS with pleckstrin-like domain